jgi:hypothetical protein
LVIDTVYVALTVLKLDVDGTVSEDVEAQLAAVEGVLKVRVIR